MSVGREIPVSVQAVDAFGVDAVRKVYPNWERRNDLHEEDFAEVAELSNLVFATDGKVLLPKPYLKLKGNRLTPVTAPQAFRIFGLQALASVSERGVAPLSPVAIERFQKFLASEGSTSLKSAMKSAHQKNKGATTLRCAPVSKEERMARLKRHTGK